MGVNGEPDQLGLRRNSDGVAGWWSMVIKDGGVIDWTSKPRGQHEQKKADGSDKSNKYIAMRK